MKFNESHNNFLNFSVGFVLVFISASLFMIASINKAFAAEIRSIAEDPKLNRLECVVNSYGIKRIVLFDDLSSSEPLMDVIFHYAEGSTSFTSVKTENFLNLENEDLVLSQEGSVIISLTQKIKQPADAEKGLKQLNQYFLNRRGGDYDQTEEIFCLE
ncbi:MAG: hypothetical protein ABL927_00525 [Bdellovibrionales bacterium]